MGTPSLTVYTNYDGVAPEVWNPPGQEMHDYIIMENTCGESQFEEIIAMINSHLET